MKIKSLVITTILLTSTIWSQAQQINPVPDYVFRNQMSVGRNAVTDTAAYFSIGPRYGATKGFMPPIVGDTATFSSGKRNGLLIFSVQKNKFLYWDSVRVQWSDMAGSSGAYIVAGDTASMLAPYLRKADTTAMLSPYYRSATASAALALKLNISDTSSMLANYIRHAGYGLTKSGQSFLVDTLNIATRAWRQKGLDSLAALEVSGSGTTNYVAKFTAGSTIGNSQIFDNGTSVGIGTSSPSEKLDVSGFIRTTSGVKVTDGTIDFRLSWASGNVGFFGNISNHPIDFYTNAAQRMRIFANGRIGINTTTDAGYQLDVNGALRSVNGANFATTSGDVGIGVTSTTGKLDVYQAGTVNHQIVLRNGGTYHTGLIGTSTGNPLTDTYAWGIFGGPNGYVTGLANAVGIAMATDVSAFKITRNNNLNSVVNTTHLQLNNTSGELLLSTTSDAGDYKLQVAGNIYTTGNIQMTGSAAIRNSVSQFIDYGTGGSGDLYIRGGSGFANVMTATNAGEVLFNTTTDAGDYKLQVVGNIYNTGSAVFAATSGEVFVGSAADQGAYKFQVTGNAIITPSDIFALTINRSGINAVGANITTTNGGMKWGVENNDGGEFFSNSTPYASVIGSTGLRNLEFGVNGYVQARFTTGGEFLITSSTSDAGNYKLQVAGNGYFQGSISTSDDMDFLGADWYLGDFVGGTPTAVTTGAIRVSINGTYYYLQTVTLE